jgi:hypothetical protein
MQFLHSSASRRVLLLRYRGRRNFIHYGDHPRQNSAADPQSAVLDLSPIERSLCTPAFCRNHNGRSLENMIRGLEILITDGTEKPVNHQPALDVMSDSGQSRVEFLSILAIVHLNLAV